MNTKRILAVLLVLAMWVAVSLLAADMSLATEGKVPGQPFAALQRQIDELQVQLTALQAQAATLQMTDIELQSQIDELRHAGEACAQGTAVIGFDAQGNLLCGPVGGGGSPEMALYDDFGQRDIDYSRWDVIWSGDCTVEVNSGMGALFVRGAAIPPARATCGVSFARPEVINGFGVNVRVTEYVANSGSFRAQLYGRFFNADSPFPSDSYGDVHTLINAGGFDPNTGIGDVTFLLRVCNNADCTQSVVLASGTLGSIRIGESHSIWVRLDGGTVFTYYFDGEPVRTYDVAAEYGLSNQGPPFDPLKRISAGNFGTADGYITSLFDNVRCESPYFEPHGPCPTN